MYSEEELLPLSGLQHMAYCQRQWALIHLEQYWAENRLTVEGRHLHERADKPTGKSRQDVRIVRGMPIHSLRLGLTGRADVVEFHRLPLEVRSERTDSQKSSASARSGDVDLIDDGVSGVRLPKRKGRWQPFPIEYKRGKPKFGNCDRVQLCAQALCLEEMLGVVVPAGALFYGRIRRRDDIVFDDTLRRETETLAARMHELFKQGTTPLVAYEKKRCDRCSLYDRCLPKSTGHHRSVSEYLAAAIQE